MKTDTSMNPSEKDVQPPHSVRPEPVEGLPLTKKRYAQIRKEYDHFLRKARFDNRDKTHQMVMTYAVHFHDLLEGFNAITKYLMPLTQAPALILRGMYEVMVKLLFLSSVVHTRDENPSELLKRTDALIRHDAKELLKQRNTFDKAFPNDFPSAQTEYDALIANLTTDLYEINTFEMLKKISVSDADACYLTYRKLSEYAHGSIEGMRAILKFGGTGDSVSISAFSRTDADLSMWYSCSTSFTEGALHALKQLLTSVRTEPVEVSENPSTSSERTGIA